jgi:hypothetical protein
MATSVAPRGCVLLLVAGLALVAACGGDGGSNSGNPGAPSPGGSSSGACRTYPTAATVTTTAPGLTINSTLTGNFNTSNNTSTITTVSANGAPCTSSVNTYRSKDDFVDEVRVTPGVLMQTATTTTNSGGCGSGTSAVSYNYDGQRRLTSFTTTTLGVSGTTTYTAWDGSGRPTQGIFPGGTLQNVYDDAARTMTQTQTSGGAVSTTLTTVDANGNQVSVVARSGPVTTTTTFANTGTAQVCK